MMITSIKDSRTIEPYIASIQSHNAVLVLNDGSYFYGRLIGAQDGQRGEICFNTGMTGYQEVISDPSYANQIIVFSFPHIGNVGVNITDNESKKIYINGIILGDIPTSPTNHRHQNDFLTWLEQNKVGGIWGIDTRNLIKKIASSSIPIKGIIKKFDGELEKKELIDLINESDKSIELSGSKLSDITGSKNIFHWDTPEWDNQYLHDSTLVKIGVIDFGVKHNILKCLFSRNCEVIVFPENITIEELMEAGVQGIVLSNGPGDPRTVGKETLKTIKQLIDAEIPILGICLGYQIIAYLYDAKISHMSCGHHGINHPVKDLKTGRILITSQNHEFVVDFNHLPDSLEPTHISLFDNSLEGFRIRDKSVIAFQFHPEASPGPHDAKYLFNEFIDLVIKNA